MARTRGDFTTVAGLVPSMKEVLYTPNTADIKDIIQTNFNALVIYNNNAVKTDQQYAASHTLMPENVDILVNAIQCGDMFVTLNVSLPMSCVVSKKPNTVDNSNVFPAFDLSGNDDQRVQINKGVWSYFKRYLYTQEEAALFRSHAWRSRNAPNASNRSIEFLCAYAMPKVRVIDGSSLVTFNIDVIKFFHEAMKIEGDSRPYQIYIQEVTRLKDTDYRFSILRVLKSNKGKHNDENSFIDKLMGGPAGNRRQDN